MLTRKGWAFMACYGSSLTKLGPHKKIAISIATNRMVRSKTNSHFSRPLFILTNSPTKGHSEKPKSGTLTPMDVKVPRWTFLPTTKRFLQVVAYTKQAVSTASSPAAKAPPPTGLVDVRRAIELIPIEKPETALQASST
jgi:hypothetical protein